MAVVVVEVVMGDGWTVDSEEIADGEGGEGGRRRLVEVAY
jgi:hypothetical protein